MKKIIIAIVIVVIVVIGAFILIKNLGNNTGVQNNQNGQTVQPEPNPTPVVPAVDKTKTVIGKSVEGRDVTAYHFGEGADELLFVGGLHGGYEWNTSLVAFQMMDYLKANPSVVPANLKVTVIPVANPDGLVKITGTSTAFTTADVKGTDAEKVAARFNANNVDLNRNFDCDWQTNAKWQNKTVSGGTAAFSEPESQAIRDYIAAHPPKAAVVWYSSAGGVFASNCHGGVLPETLALTEVFAKASGYPAHDNFDFYEVTGDMVNWLAKSGVPAISVLLTTHEDSEWSKNQKGIEAVIKRYTK